MELVQQLGLMVLAWGLLALPVSVACAGLWLALRRRGRVLLPSPRYFPVPWTGVEVFLIFLFQALWPSLLAVVLENELGKAEPGEEVIRRYEAIALGAPLLLLSSWLLLRLACNVRLQQLGLTRSHWRQNLLLGGWAWLVCSPWIFLGNWLVALLLEWVGQRAEPHSLSRLVQGRDVPLEWFLLLGNALAIAPLAEECLFRGVLQRWAGREATRSHILWLIALPVAALTNSNQLHFAIQAAVFWLLLLPGYLLWPALRRGRGSQPAPGGASADVGKLKTQSRSATALARRLVEQVRFDLALSFHDRFASSPPIAVVAGSDLTTQPESGPAQGPDNESLEAAPVNQAANGVRAIYATAFFFAILHPWPTPVPLFLLGLVLGWLAYRTQSLIGPMVFHLLFNAVSCLALALGLPQ